MVIKEGRPKKSTETGMSNQLLRLRLGKIYHWKVFSVSRTNHLSFLDHFITTEQKTSVVPPSDILVLAVGADTSVTREGVLCEINLVF